MDQPSAEDQVQLLRTIAAHRDYVRIGLQSITQELERRALEHDVSKYSPDEFSGFARINKAAREHPYGSEEYKAGLRQEKPTIDLHYSRNRHHPEHHENPAETMTFLDIIEMVCDWRSAWKTYGSQGTWRDNMKLQTEKLIYKLDGAQLWLMWQVSDWLQALDAR